MSPTLNALSHGESEPTHLAEDDTGWWDERGRPAPWPEDFWLPDGTINPAWQPSGIIPGEVSDPVCVNDGF